MNIKERVNSYKAQVIATRRELHRIPELGFKEEKTSAYVADYLKKEGLRVATGIARTGVVGTAGNRAPRTDTAGPGGHGRPAHHEETGLPFTSGIPGSCTPAGTTATWPWGWSPPRS
jgi:metal-dependent amidase/aminoacylase/carboxypeptidase family protein